MKYQTITPAAVAAILTFAINQLAHVYGWYQEIPFFDKWMHILGGIFIFLLAGAYLRRLTMFQILLVVLFVGLLWEGYEHAVDALFTTDLIHIRDSVGHLIADMICAFVAWSGVCFVQSAKKRYNRANAK